MHYGPSETVLSDTVKDLVSLLLIPLGVIEGVIASHYGILLRTVHHTVTLDVELGEGVIGILHGSSAE
jgi:hypothetical protein